MALRIRRSLQEVQYLYDSGEDRKPLETLIRAFRAIQLKQPNYNLPPEEDKSFFRIAGFHGEPFEGPGKYDPNWWGGYCHHNDVLFPSWHRAYLFHLETALREVPGCKDVALPFWDELADVLGGNTKTPIPTILTAPKFELDGETIDNPLFSYKFQKSLVEVVTGANERYTKHKGYETVRFPLSGLVGTDEDRKETKIHNQAYPDHEGRVSILNKNVYAWLEGTVKIDKTQDDPGTAYPDTYSVKSRYLACFNTPTYTAFSNKKSMLQYQKDHQLLENMLVSLEDPHNAIHLAVGGFYQNANYNADEIRGANGDMGDNETAGFDPIFFFHHCFIDYVFWLWQKKYGRTTWGSLEIDPTSPGAVSVEGSVGTAPNTPLTQNSYLVPFRNPNFDSDKDTTDNNPPWLTTRLVTDIESQLGYTYGIGSLSNHLHVLPALADTRARDAPRVPDTSAFVAVKASKPINRADYPGSFVIRTYAKLPSGRVIEVNRDAILSRYNLGACANCQNRLTTQAVTPISAGLQRALLAGEEEGDKDPAKITYEARVLHRHLEPQKGREGVPYGRLHESGPIPVEEF